jgi:Tripartite tricarboxylate transporter TctB family
MATIPQLVCGPVRSAGPFSSERRTVRRGDGNGMFRIKSPQDFGSAIVFLLMGLAGLYFGKDLNYGSAGHMGPGYFPFILSWMIIGIGVIVGLLSLSIEGPPIEPPQFRPLFFVLLSVVVFGYMMSYVGLAITGVVMTLIAAFAHAFLDRGAGSVDRVVAGGHRRDPSATAPRPVLRTCSSSRS